MDLTERWNAIDWQVSDFSFTADDVLAATRQQSASDVMKLLRTYRRLYYSSIGFLVITPLFILLKPQESEYVFCIGLISLYWVLVVGFLTYKFLLFRLPDLAQQPTQAIRATLDLARSINAFHANMVSFMTPVVFLGSMLGTLTYGGTHFAQLFGNAVILAIIIGCTLLVIWLSRRLRRWLTNKECVALINRLDDQLRILTTP